MSTHFDHTVENLFANIKLQFSSHAPFPIRLTGTVTSVYKFYIDISDVIEIEFTASSFRTDGYEIQDLEGFGIIGSI